MKTIVSIRKQPKQVLGHVNSQAISKCRALPELVKATVPLAGSEEEAIRRVMLVQQELKLMLSEMREACRALKAAAVPTAAPPSHATRPHPCAPPTTTPSLTCWADAHTCNSRPASTRRGRFHSRCMQRKSAALAIVTRDLHCC